jgi:uncharacterized DUF497 family protein
MLLFAWDYRNRQHIAEHGVQPEEAVEIARIETRFYPESIGSGKWRTRGRTDSGRWLQVIFVYRAVDEIDLEMLDPADRLALAELDVVGYIIHARDLSAREARALRRR